MSVHEAVKPLLSLQLRTTARAASRLRAALGRLNPTRNAASEKAINLLIQTYADSITDETNREKFKSRINNRMISTRYKEFEESYRGCKSRPTDPALAQDLETLIGQMFQFCRITRNEVGHPQIVPDLAKGVVLSNLGQFVHYIKRVYGLMAHFREKGVTV